jgi:hypothetical protein
MIITNHNPLLDLAQVADLTFSQAGKQCGTFKDVTIRSAFSAYL